jgi:hypothetical protein
MFSWSLLHDVHVAIRGLFKTPGLTFVVVLTLAVAIGANTAIFSVVESVLLKPLPYPDEDRIVRVAATVHESRGARGDRGNPFSDRGYWHFANNNRSFERFGGYIGGAIPSPLTGEGAPRQVGVGLVTASMFDVLGVFPELGRLPTPEEDAPNGPTVVLLSHELWVSQYGADPAVLGRIVYLGGMPREVIGVMPASYDFPTPDIDLWTPFQLDPASANFGGHYISGIARLAPGVTIEASVSDARSLIARFGELGYAPSWFEGIFDGGAVVAVVFGTVGFVLLIACQHRLLLVRGRAAPEAGAYGARREPRPARAARIRESALLALSALHRYARYVRRTRSFRSARLASRVSARSGSAARRSRLRLLCRRSRRCSLACCRHWDRSRQEPSARCVTAAVVRRWAATGIARAMCS